VLPRRFGPIRPFFILGVILGVWLILPVVLKSILRTTLYELQAPAAATTSYVRDLQDFWAMKAASKNELIEANRDLTRIIAGYDVSNQQNESLRAEITRLENLLNLPSQPAFRYEPARVVSRDFSAWWQRLVIRKGANYNIPVGAPVVFTGGVVGRISEVYAYTAVVDLISSPTVRLAAMVEGDNRPISFQGGLNQSFSAPRGSVEFVPLDVYASAAETKRLVTSGLGGVFPAGLTIGAITKLEPSTDGLFKSGEVLLDPRLGSLTEVAVMVPLNPAN
jgi:rod shape-determining protein MreC